MRYPGFLLRRNRRHSPLVLTLRDLPSGFILWAYERYDLESDNLGCSSCVLDMEFGNFWSFGMKAGGVASTKSLWMEAFLENELLPITSNHGTLTERSAARVWRGDWILETAGETKVHCDRNSKIDLADKWIEDFSRLVVSRLRRFAGVLLKNANPQ